MEVLLLLLALLLLWVYISWDGDRIATQARLKARARPKGAEFLPGALITVPALLVAAAALGATAVILTIQPPLPPFTGRGSWIASLLYSALGRYGFAVVASGLALVCVASAAACLRKSQTGEA